MARDSASGCNSWNGCPALLGGYGGTRDCHDVGRGLPSPGMTSTTPKTVAMAPAMLRTAKLMPIATTPISVISADRSGNARVTRCSDTSIGPWDSASRTARTYPDDTNFVVLRDPDGNEFCSIDHDPLRTAARVITR